MGFRRALRVARLYLLYPVIHDEYRLRAALVEARLRTSQPSYVEESAGHTAPTTFSVTGT